MARTVENVITRVQELLQDEMGVRYTQAQIIARVNDAVLEARSIRPDLFIGVYAAELPQVTLPADPIPLPDQFFGALCFFVAGMCELRDDEFAVDGRATTLLSAFGSKLIKGA